MSKSMMQLLGLTKNNITNLVKNRRDTNSLQKPQASIVSTLCHNSKHTHSNHSVFTPEPKKKEEIKKKKEVRKMKRRRFDEKEKTMKIKKKTLFRRDSCRTLRMKKTLF